MQSAAQQGSNPDELVQQVVSHYLDEESRFTNEVNRGEEAFQRGAASTLRMSKAASALIDSYRLDGSPLSSC